MELLSVATTSVALWNPLVCFEVLAFDSVVAGEAEGAVQFVVMLGAVRMVVKDVEIRSKERGATRVTHKTGFVVTACQSAVG